MDISISEDFDNGAVLFHRCFRCLLKAIAWYSSAITVGIEIASLESILYTTCLLLYTLEETATRALIARLIICTIILFETQTPILSVGIASYYTFYSSSFERYTEIILFKLTVIRLFSFFVEVTKYLFMYATMALIAVGYKDFVPKGAEDIFLLFVVGVPLVQSFMEAITKDTMFLVFLSAVCWGDRKLNRQVEEVPFFLIL